MKLVKCHLPPSLCFFSVFYRVLACFGVFYRVSTACGIALPGLLEASTHFNFKERWHICPRCAGVRRKCNVSYYAVSNFGGGTEILILHGFTWLYIALHRRTWLAPPTGTRRPFLRTDGFGWIEALLPFRQEMEQHKSCPLCGLGRLTGRASRPCYHIAFFWFELVLTGLNCFESGELARRRSHRDKEGDPAASPACPP